MHPVPYTIDGLIRLSTLVELLQRSRASIYRDIAKGYFPKPLKIGSSSRWRLSEVTTFIADLTESRENG